MQAFMEFLYEDQAYRGFEYSSFNDVEYDETGIYILLPPFEYYTMYKMRETLQPVKVSLVPQHEDWRIREHHMIFSKLSFCLFIQMEDKNDHYKNLPPVYFKLNNNYNQRKDLSFGRYVLKYTTKPFPRVYYKDVFMKLSSTDDDFYVPINKPPGLDEFIIKYGGYVDMDISTISEEDIERLKAEIEIQTKQNEELARFAQMLNFFKQ